MPKYPSVWGCILLEYIYKWLLQSLGEIVHDLEVQRIIWSFKNMHFGPLSRVSDEYSNIKILFNSSSDIEYLILIVEIWVCKWKKKWMNQTFLGWDMTSWTHNNVKFKNKRSYLSVGRSDWLRFCFALFMGVWSTNCFVVMFLTCSQLELHAKET